MVFLFTPGKALGCNVNSHRSGWSGTVCSDATNWNCSADQLFRDSYCMRGDERCYHMNMFNPDQPRFRIDDNGIGWMLQVDPRALDDQVVLLWGGDFGEPRGLKENRYGKGIVYGAYRVKAARKIDLPHRVLWELSPYADGWSRFHNLMVLRPPSRSLSGKYMREVDRSSLRSVFAEGIRILDDRRDLDWFESQDEMRFRKFAEHLDGWLDHAEKVAEVRGYGRRGAMPELVVRPVPASVPASVPAVPTASPVKAKGSPAPLAQGPARVVVPAGKTDEVEVRVATEAPRTQPFAIDPATQKQIADTYGEDTVRALRIAVATKQIVILRGNTGVGKSHLALRLYGELSGDRTLVVPVASTWRGREDLLGYVNPISNEFEPTAFTSFLYSTWAAWRRGDQAVRVVVFEEFNLSQPEHWLSDVLVVSQYDDINQRRIRLGGKSVRGIVDSGDAVTLAPNVRFIATINNDHTTRLLSPRVLDRAAIVELDLEPREVIRIIGMALPDEQILPIQEVDEVLRLRSAAFSLRAARSLAQCLQQMSQLAIDTWQAIDFVLAQEVLSKVRLLARDPGDADLLRELQRWSEKHGRNLQRCARIIENWGETLGAGHDVIQA